MNTLFTRPWPAALALAAAAQLLFSWRLATPHVLVFDEIHYVPAARALWALQRPVNTEHPLLGKALIGLGMQLFGDNPLGWRAMSTLAGTATVLGLFACAWLLFGRVRTALLAGLFAMLNFTLFVQARIAMLDGFMAALVVAAVAAMLWSIRGTGRQVWRRWLLGSVLLGLAAGVKWAAAPYIGFAGMIFLLARRGAPHRWPELAPGTALVTLGVASGAAYAVTFLPAFFYARQPLTLPDLLPFQLQMLAEQRRVLPHHPYQSAWYGWPLLLRPIWYSYQVADGARRGILMLGNPAVMWGGLVAVIACLWGWARDGRTALGGVAALWLGGWGMWALIPKSLGFYYYYYLPSLWLPLALAATFHHFWRVREWDEVALALAAALFVYFYPILAAGALAGPWSFRRWMWLGSWT